MPYSQGRIVHDADAHIMETPTWLRDHAEPAYRDRMPVLRYPGGNELRQTGDPSDQQRDLVASFEALRARHASPEYRADEEAEIMARKNFAATGSFIRRGPRPRPRSPRLLEPAASSTRSTTHACTTWNTTTPTSPTPPHAPTTEACSSSARPTRACCLRYTSRWPTRPAPSPPPRMPWRKGAAALLIASGCPPGHSPSHIDLFGVWARAEEAGIPVVFHVGGTGTLIDPNYFVNGKPVPPDFHGGEENFRSVDYMGIPAPPAQTLATLIFDGVLEKFPDLHIGVIEQGAIWVPSWLRQMESAFEAFHRHEERLQALSLRPSDYVHRQCRFTPYPTEDVGWIVEQAGADLVLFSSDYPHVEGGRKPLERFEASLVDADADVRRRFYADNFLFLMGSAATALAA